MTSKVISFKIRGFEPNCPVCLEQWSVDIVSPWIFSCGHMICESCYMKQKKIKQCCHICRQQFVVKKERKEKKKLKAKSLHEYIIEIESSLLL